MISRKDSNWLNNYEALKAYILERGHLPDKHVVTNRSLLSWAKYTKGRRSRKERWMLTRLRCSMNLWV